VSLVELERPQGSVQNALRLGVEITHAGRLAENLEPLRRVRLVGGQPDLRVRPTLHERLTSGHLPAGRSWLFPQCLEVQWPSGDEAGVADSRWSLGRSRGSEPETLELIVEAPDGSRVGGDFAVNVRDV
jgi:hypothetical protein